jgi:hypothetical protein
MKMNKFVEMLPLPRDGLARVCGRLGGRKASIAGRMPALPVGRYQWGAPGKALTVDVPKNAHGEHRNVSVDAMRPLRAGCPRSQ